LRVFRSLERARGAFSRPVVTIGNFDGVHRGHAVILDLVRADAERRKTAAVALTFEPHPITVLRPRAAPKLLMRLGDRLAAMARHGLAATVVQPFTARFAEITAREFVERFLVEILDAEKLVVGHDLNFGRGREGSVDSLVADGSRYGFSVEVIRPVSADGVVVHSTVIRGAVADGDVALAATLLGRPHVVRGRVVPGAGRGRRIGFATANIRPCTQLAPGEGVYATRAEIDRVTFDGVTSIGTTPTFGGTETVIESHLFTESRDFYGRPIRLHFLERIRDQRKFENAEALGAQIRSDVESARAILARRPA
jgi:riboflavin kinase/FMN adenylyltransferase